METSERDSSREIKSKTRRIRHALKNITIELLVFLCVASAVLKFVVLPQLLLETICNRDYTASVCKNINLPENSGKQADVQASAAKWMIGLFSCSLSISLFTVPLLGSLADVVGKKRVLYIPVILYTAQSIVYSVLSYNPSRLYPGYLFICAVLGGLSGDMVALTLLSTSYISDITTEEQRTFRITLIDGILNLSLCIFMFCSGYIIMAVGFSYVFIVSLGIDVLAMACLIFLVPNDAVCFKEKSEPEDNVPMDEKVAVDRSDFPDLNQVGNAVTDKISCEQDSGALQREVIKENWNVGIGIGNSIELQIPGTDAHRNVSNVQESAPLEKKTYQGESEVDHDESEASHGVLEADQAESEAGYDEPKPDHDESEADQDKAEVGEVSTNNNNNKQLSLKVLLSECNPVRRFMNLRKFLKEKGQTSSVVMFLIILGIATMCIVGESLTLVLYITNKPFNMDSVNVGYLLSLQGFLRFAGGYSFLNIIFQRCCKLRDVNIISVSFAFNLIYFILLGAANTKHMLYGIQVMSIFGPLAGPTLRSVISKKGDSTSHATILSIALTIDAIASFIVNLIVNSTYAIMAKLYPGAFCFVLAAISMLGLIMSFVVRRFNASPSADDADKVTDNETDRS